jgi:hypothetical protein
MAVMTVLAAAGSSSSAGGSGGPSSQHHPHHNHHQQQQQQQQATSPEVVIFSDELNHASIIDGARLAARGGGAVRLEVYRHSDLSHLEQLLRSCPAGARTLVVTDGLFSMDGDFADLRVSAVWGCQMVGVGPRGESEAISK